MSLQIQGSIEIIVTIRTAKILEDCIYVSHVEYMVVVSQQSQNVFVFLQISSSKFFDNVPIDNIYIIQQYLQK